MTLCTALWASVQRGEHMPVITICCTLLRSALQELQAKTEQAAAALLAEEEADRAKAQAVQAKKDKKKQKRVMVKAQKLPIRQTCFC